MTRPTKRGPGRPRSAPDGAVRDHRMTVWLTEDERAELERAAADADVSVAELIRARALRRRLPRRR